MYQTLLILLGGTLGALATFVLQKFELSAVVASCIVGLVGAMLGHFLKNEHLALIIFAGSFVGMTSTGLGSYPLVGLGGLVAGLIYLFSLDVFAGFGGRLGTIAFLSALASWAVFTGVSKLM